ncbi:TetR/AcrR family transcriptional regulator [Leekyejoonella antrihumi]|uniref:TetR/AcrR family transcriptional regulator n=1 Tax=Leekyejoonella antrihumi TaxID=1660198 RepID=A0A563E071_9MICO|nr:TetR/AcrR family transcriptional regulator [Leekyejoonella antrihumi]TWP35284.1 TetR/AcrR family transcriptional regulator [Leekyejoonella antrihumi]
MSRRDELLQQATDYALEHGLIGLSLRPMAAALGTSDRMLLYHFGSKDALVIAVIDESTRRSSEVLRDLPPAQTVRAGVLRLWEVHTDGQLDRCQHLYEQASASGLLGDEPYRSAVRQSNEIWAVALVDYLTACGATRTGARRVVPLLDAALMGFHLDYGIEADSADLRRGVRDLADAVHRLTE